MIPRTADELWPLACPRCKKPLSPAAPKLRCPQCGTDFSRSGAGCWDFREGNIFEDWFSRSETSAAEFAAHAGRTEDAGAQRIVSNYLVPLLNRLALSPDKTVVLSDGCGGAADVEHLRSFGYETWGVDPGLRSREWSSRTCIQYLLHGDGTNLPFASAAFDFVFSEGVIEHVGFSGDHNFSSEVSQREKLKTDRIAYCREIYRVLRPGGYALIGGPNRLFPIDFFHGVRSFLGLAMRFHSIREPFLASASDIRAWFEPAATVTPLSPDGFFNTSSLSRRGMVGKGLAALWTGAVRFLPPRLISVVGPHFIVLIRKEQQH